MPHFAYKGRNAKRDLVRGVLESANAGAAADQLIKSGISPIEIAPTAAPKTKGGQGWARGFLSDKITLEDLLLFCQQMHTLLKAGVPILRSLAALQESATKKTFADLMLDLRASLDSGRTLSTAMSQYPAVFTLFYVSMVRVGELTGTLEEVFLLMFGHLEFERQIKTQVSQALRYPMFVVFAMAGALVIINLLVIPSFAKVFASFKTELPLMTRVLIGFSEFMVQYWPVLIVGAAGAYIFFRLWVGSAAGRYLWDRIKLQLPIAGKIVLKATLARFVRSLSIALRSGVPVIQALTVVAQVAENGYVRRRIEQMRDGVERGESMVRAARTTEVFTPVVMQMIAVGEEAGELDELLLEVAQLYQREVEYDLKMLSANIEPILIVGLGGMVLVLALGVFLPIWDLGQAAMAGGGR